jgi:hypothetical protein
MFGAIVAAHIHIRCFSTNVEADWKYTATINAHFQHAFPVLFGVSLRVLTVCRGGPGSSGSAVCHASLQWVQILPHGSVEYATSCITCNP